MALRSFAQIIANNSTRLKHTYSLLYHYYYDGEVDKELEFERRQVGDLLCVSSCSRLTEVDI